MATTTVTDVPLYSGDAPNRLTQQQAEFSANSDDSLGYQATLADNMNVSIGEMNTLGAEVTQLSSDAETASLVSQSNANFVGNWSDQTGAANVPYSVAHNSNNWQLLIDVADVTASEPSTSNSEWKIVNSQKLSGNLIVDGKFDFWFEGINQTSSGYGSDTMWSNENSGSTKTHSQQTLALGSDIPKVPGAEFYSRTVVASVVGVNNFVLKRQLINSVRTLAGKKSVMAFYAKADSPKNISVELQQAFGSGGSPSSSVSGIGTKKIAVTTSFERYEVIIDVPALTGKTIGTNGDDRLAVNFWFDAGSSIDARTDALGHQSGTFDIACVSLEEGFVTTNFPDEERSASLKRVDWYFQYDAIARNSIVNATVSYFGSPVQMHSVMRGDPAVSFGSVAGVRDSLVSTNLGTRSQSGGSIMTDKNWVFLDLVLSSTYSAWATAYLTLDARL